MVVDNCAQCSRSMPFHVTTVFVAALSKLHNSCLLRAQPAPFAYTITVQYVHGYTALAISVIHGFVLLLDPFKIVSLSPR
jgi:hypothetical protein